MTDFADGAYDGVIHASLPIAGLGLVLLGLALASIFAIIGALIGGAGRGIHRAEFIGLVLVVIGVLTIHDNPPAASSHYNPTPPAHTQTHQEVGQK